MRPRAELDIKVPSRPAGLASEPGQIPPESGGLRPYGTHTSGLRGTPAAARAGKFPESRANKEGAGGARARPHGRRRTRPGRAGARAREERRARSRTGPAHLPGRRLLPPGARRKHQRSPPSPGRGRGSGRGRVRPLRAAPTPGGGTQCPGGGARGGGARGGGSSRCALRDSDPRVQLLGAWFLEGRSPAVLGGSDSRSWGWGSLGIHQV